MLPMTLFGRAGGVCLASARVPEFRSLVMPAPNSVILSAKLLAGTAYNESFQSSRKLQSGHLMQQFAAAIVVYTMVLAFPDAAFSGQETSEIALPAIETAGSDDRGRISVNGKPFFPILMYDVPTDADTLKMLRDHGFNVLSAPVEEATNLR